MSTTIKVQGMHCDACKTLVSMELEEIGLQDKVSEIMIDSKKNQGTLQLTNESQEDIDAIKKAIEGMEQYSIL